MEENQFFRFVWRFNALVIMIAGLLTIVVLGLGASQIFGDMTRRQKRNIVNIDNNNIVKEKWEFGNLQEIEGTSYVIVPLYSDQSYAQSYYSKSTNSIRNYLFIDEETGKSEFLFPHNNFLINNKSFIFDKIANNQGKNIQAIIYNLIKEDTNNDKRLTNSDLLTMALSKSSGNGYKEVLTGLDKLLGYKVVNSNSLLVLYQKNEIVYSAKVSLSNFSLSNEVELPKIESKP